MVRRPTEAVLPLAPGKWRAGSHTHLCGKSPKSRWSRNTGAERQPAGPGGGGMESGVRRAEARSDRRGGFYLNYGETHKGVLSRE